MLINRARLIIILTAAATLASSSLLRAGDVTWTNDFGNFLWNTTDPNWSTGMWNNANGDGAIFGATGAGAINVTSPINVSSLNFTANGYTLGGAGSLSFIPGTSTLGYGFVNVADSVTATINTAVTSADGIIKLGGGTLELGGPMTFTGPGFAIGGRGTLPADLIVGGGSDSNNNPISGGTIKILNSSVLPTTARLGVSNGLIDFGSNNITIAALNFVNQTNYTTPYNPATGVAGAGVFGTGTLRVTGDISVLGVNTGNFYPNAIGNNLDLGGGTQVIRTASNGSFASFHALELTGSLSNGSLLKTFGVTESGILGNPDGLALLGNNTYTGSTTINGGSTIMTGTNATTSVKIVGDRGLGAPFGTNLTLQGANGSLGSATTIQAVAGAQFIIDNNAALTSFADPNTPAAQNNDRIRDDAEIQLRDGSFIYRGLSNTAGSETFGNLNIQGGHNNVTLTPNGTGTVTVTANGNLTLAPRATLQVTSATLGGASKMFINGTLPAADATGILSHVVGSTDFLTYKGTTGLTPYTGYATDFSTPGTNVAVTAAASVPTSVNVNAIKTTGTFATTIAAGQTLGVTSGMLLNTTGTRTYTGGTIAFGANPGVFYSGTAGSGGTTINSAITGTGGLINTNSATLALNGDLSGLTGTITNGVGFATTTLATNTFAGAIEVRGGTFNITTSQTLAGQGAITLGVAANDQHLINNALTLSFSGAGTGSTIGRDIIVDNGSYDAAGLPVTFGFIPTIAPLSNSGTNVQTLSGNITLNSPVRLQGGGGTSGTGYTALTGNISGPAQFFLANGRQTLSGSYSNAGGFRMGEQGFTEQATFTGTPIGTAPIVLEGGNNSLVAYNAGSLPTGTITEEGATGGFTTSLNPLQNSTINNAIVLGTTGVPGGTLTSNVASGITGNWNGQISGTGGITKATGTGTLVLNGNNTYTGNTAVNAGTLLVNGSSASALHTVASAATLGGNGSIGAATVNTGGTLSPGSSIGTFATGNLTLAGTFLAEINLNNGGAASADLVNLAGNFSITGGTLELSLSNLPLTGAPGTYLLVANDGSDGITGTFAGITGLPEGYTATVDYGFTGTDSLGRIGNGNDLAVQVVPEPQSYALLVLGGLLTVGLLRLRRRRV